MNELRILILYDALSNTSPWRLRGLCFQLHKLLNNVQCTCMSFVCSCCHIIKKMFQQLNISANSKWSKTVLNSFWTDSVTSWNNPNFKCLIYFDVVWTIRNIVPQIVLTDCRFVQKKFLRSQLQIVKIVT